jgi:hypothetical protein
MLIQLYVLLDMLSPFLNVRINFPNLNSKVFLSVSLLYKQQRGSLY